MAFAKKSSATSQEALLIASTNFKKSVVELKAGLALVDGLEEKVEELQATIAQKEDKIASLEVDYAEKLRQAEVKLSLDIKAKQDSTVLEILNAQNKVAIERANYNAINKSLTDLQANFETKLEEAEEKYLNEYSAKFESNKILLKAEFDKKEAENTAKITVLEMQIKFLNEQVNQWKNACDAERQASIERAKAQGGVNVTVPTATK